MRWQQCVLWALGALCLVVLSACASSSKPANSIPTATCADCPGEKELAVVFDNDAPSFFVRGTVNGQPKRFFLDTGSYRSMLVADAQVSALAPFGQYKFGGAAMQPKTCDWVRLDSFQVAGIPYSKAPLIRCDVSLNSRNYMGIDYLDHLVLSLEMDRRAIHLWGSAPPKLKMQPMKRNSERFIELPVQLAGQTEWAIFDTGASVTTMDQAFVTQHAAAFSPLTVDVDGQPKQVTANVPDATGTTVSGNLYVIDNVQIGEVHFPKLLIMAVPFSEPMKQKIERPIILGANAIVQANWVFDLKHDLWAIKGPHSQHGINVQVAADHITQNGDILVLQGNAKVSQALHNLSADHIEFDSKAGTVQCRGGCIYSKLENTVKKESMAFVITKDAWALKE